MSAITETQGRWLVVSRPDQIDLWDADVVQSYAQVDGCRHSGYIALSRNGCWALSWRDCDLLVWDIAGRQQHLRLTQASDIVAATIGPLSRRLIVVTDTGRLVTWTIDSGAKLGEFQLTRPVRSVVFHGSEHVLTLGVDGTVEVWHLSAGIRVANPLSEYQPCSAVAATGSGHVLALAGIGGTVRYHNVHAPDRSVQLCGHGARITCLAVAENGMGVVAGRADGTVSFWRDRTTNVRELGRFGSAILAVAIAPAGDQIAAVTGDGQARLWCDIRSIESVSIGDVTGAYDNVHYRAGLQFGPCSRWSVQLAPIQARIREALAISDHLGVCQWIEEFDRLLVAGHLQACDSLLETVRSDMRQYGFKDAEARFIDSREGALWMRHAALLHLRGDVEEAAFWYDESRARQAELGCLAAVGQVDFLRELLHEPYSGLVDEEMQSINVLGDGSRVLRERLYQCDGRERARIISAALQQGLPQPMLAALDDPEPATRAKAAAALTRIEQSYDIEPLLASLADEHWVVRWRAAAALGARAECVHASVEPLGAALAREGEPEVRRTIAQALGALGDIRAASYLLQALDDDDPDVRYAVAEALAKAGDRRALAALKRVHGGHDVRGLKIVLCADEARSAIEERCRPAFRATCELLHHITDHPYWRQTRYIGPRGQFMVALSIDPQFEQLALTVQLCGHDRVLWSFSGTAQELRRQHELDLPPTERELLMRRGQLGGPTDECEPGVGERVQYIGDLRSDNDYIRYGDVGTVRGRLDYDQLIGVEWDRHIAGHSLEGLRGRCKPGHGLFVYASELRRLMPAPLESSQSRGAWPLLLDLPASLSTHLAEPGTYQLVVAEHNPDGEYLAEITTFDFERIAGPKIAHAQVVTPGYGDGDPLLVLTGTEAKVMVHMMFAHAGTSLCLRLYPADSEDTVHETSVVVARDGDQEIDVPLPRLHVPGTIYLELHIHGAVHWHSTVEVIDEIRVEELVLYDEDADQIPSGARISCHPNMFLVLALDVSRAPSDLQVLALYEHIDGQSTIVALESDTTLGSSEPEWFEFTFYRPDDGWQRGRSRIRVAVLWPDESWMLHDEDSATGVSGYAFWSVITEERWTTVEFYLE